jgi:cytochrome b involved in lipid metabolism
MNKKVYVIGIIIIVLIVIISVMGGKDTSAPSVDDMISTTTVATTTDVTATTTATTTKSVATTTVSTASTTVASYTMAQVATHKDAKSCWSAIDGKVYDLTKAIDVHPGGREKVLAICGKDGSSAFGDQHGDNKEIVASLQTMVIGTLAK